MNLLEFRYPYLFVVKMQGILWSISSVYIHTFHIHTYAYKLLPNEAETFASSGCVASSGSFVSTELLSRLLPAISVHEASSDVAPAVVLVAAPSAEEAAGPVGATAAVVPVAAATPIVRSTSGCGSDEAEFEVFLLPTTHGQHLLLWPCPSGPTPSEQALKGCTGFVQSVQR